MPRITFVPSATATATATDIRLPDSTTASLDPTRLQSLLNNPEPQPDKKTNQYPAEWLVSTGQGLYQLLGLPQDYLSRGDLLELDFTRLPGDSPIPLLPWELLNDGITFLAEQTIAILRVVQDAKSGKTTDAPPEDRPLSLLFQACSPENTGTPLDFEKEEDVILKTATASRGSIELITEETGTLEGLDLMLQDRGELGIDAFHLTGHADLYERFYTPPQWLSEDRQPGNGAAGLPEHTPVFLMENDIGDCELATAQDLTEKAFRNTLPKLMFVSGCKTGQQRAGATTPSMAKALIANGARAVMAWRQPVRDDTATSAAQEFYTHVSKGSSVEKAAARAVQFLSQRNSDGGFLCPDWHLLQLYRDSVPLPPFVVPASHRTRHAQHLKPEEPFYLGEKRVAGPAEFVGRRRPLQRCLRSLLEQRPVVLWGVGGVGKSSVAARLCRRTQQRFPKTHQIVVRGKLSDQTLREALGGADLETFLNRQPNTLLVLDNFEDNQILSGGNESGFLLDGEAYRTLEQIARIIGGRNGANLIVTTRYWDSRAFPPMGDVFAESLTAMTDADVRKKQRRMKLDLTEDQASKLSGEACGNPRLLERIAYLPETERDSVREQYVASELRFADLWSQLTNVERNHLQQLNVTTLDFPESAILALGLTLARPVALGLVERGNGSSALSPIARAAIPPLPESEAAQIAQIIAPLLDEGLKAKGRKSLEQARELLRLGFVADNQEVACSNGDRIALALRNNHQWNEAKEICELLLARFEDYRTLSTYSGVLRHLGATGSAIAASRRALELIPEKDLGRQAFAWHSLGSLQQQTGDISSAMASFQRVAACADVLNSGSTDSGESLRSSALHAMAGVLAQQGEVERALSLWRESLEIKEKIGDVKGKAATLHNMAGVLAQQGEVERALSLWRESLEIEDKIGDVKGKAATLHEMAGVLAQQGEVERALSLWRESLEIQEKIGDVKGKAATLHNMAGVLAQQGEVEQALSLWRDSLEIDDKIRDVKGKAATLHQMAGVLAQQGEVERALSLWRESLEIKEKIGDVQGKAATLHEMAGVLAQQGEVERALSLWRESLEIKEKIGNVKGKAATLHQMAGVLAQQGEVERALSLWRESLEIKEKIGDVKGKAATLHQMAGVLAQQGEVERALSLWRESLEIKEKIGDVKGKAATLHNMAGVLAQQGEVERALSLWRKSLEIEDKIGDVQGKAATLHAMAGVLAQQGEVERALSLWRESLEIEDKIGNLQGKAATLHAMAGVLAQQGEVERALSLWRESLEIHEKIGDVKGKAATLHNMAGVLAQQGEVERALSLWRESLEIHEKIGDVKGKAATLHEMAGVLAQQGEVERALSLWRESLEIKEKIGDVQGKAATFANMGWAYGSQGDTAKQIESTRRAAEALAGIRAYPDLITVLGNLGATDEPKAAQWFAQALWLALRIDTRPGKVAQLITALFHAVPSGDRLGATLAWVAMMMAAAAAQAGPSNQSADQLPPESFKTALNMATIIAKGQGVPEDGLNAWLQEWLGSTDPEAIDASLDEDLQTLIGDTWIYDPEPLRARPRKAFGKGAAS